MSNAIQKVATSAIKHFAPVLHSQAIRIFTPFPDPIPIDSCKLRADLKRFLVAYEPKLKQSGLFPHQAEFLSAYAAGGSENFIITTATGSGKSLCFWSWVLDRLAQNPDATAILCFPTQALMWGQSERLARLSNPKRLVKPDGESTYAGSIKYGKQEIGWTIWLGTTQDAVMREHEKTDAFKSARIRIATLDKAHYSLLRGDENKRFAKRLTSFVLDEAHSYHGVFGANVHYFLKRLFLANEIFGQPRPGFFLASATLCSARQFAATLLSLKHENEIVHIEDSMKQNIELVAAADVPKHLSDPPADGLLRVVLLLNDTNTEASLVSFMGNERQMGDKVNAIYFSQSKLHGKRLKQSMERKKGKRAYTIYDADLPAKKRREVERQLNDSEVCGTTVLATSALELGVDIEGLDACFIDQIPPSRADLLQRIGRVGRRANRPGLVLLSLSAEPHDQQVLENAEQAFRLDLSRPLPIPLHVEMLRWRHALAAFREWVGDLKKDQDGWSLFNQALEKHFGFDKAPSWSQLKGWFESSYGSLVDMNHKFWVHSGFRASASQGKIPLKEGTHEVASIEDIAIFRDAHPEAVYLGHNSVRYRVVAYTTEWKEARWEHPESDVVLGKWLASIKAVQVKREPKFVTTQGSWDASFAPYEIEPITDGRCPKRGRLSFGVWDYVRKWQGYKEIDLKTNKERKVPLNQVAKRFSEALERGETFPFLHNLTYRTQGWQWDFGAIELLVPDVASQRSLGKLTGSILEHFLAEAVESRITDFGTQLDLPGHRFQILDSTPGGNGLSETLLMDDRIPAALQGCTRTLAKFNGRGSAKKFEKYVVTLCHEKPSHSLKEVTHVFGELYKRWSG